MKILLGAAALLLLAGCASAAKTVNTTTLTTASSSSEANTSPAKSSEAVSSPAKSSETSNSASSFKNGVLTTPEMKIGITSHKIIPVGTKGNEYGTKPVIAFWYQITNLTEKQVSPMNFLYEITAYQDNNPNAENKLGVGSLPDDRFLESQLENVKKGGTVENAMAYELDDLTTPVDLVASDDLGMTKIGKVTYALK